jgi:SAM-dependent methyltransferase
VEDSAALIDFYDRAYSMSGSEAQLYAGWRALGAIGKADHVMALCARGGVQPRSTLDVGCGDGALLADLAGRGFGGRLIGAEISEPAARIASSRPQIAEVARFEGRELPFATGSHDLGLLSHVLEHVPAPTDLLREVARVCRAVVIEVPLEANLSARRGAKREHAAEIGHLQRLDRAAARGLVTGAGLEVACELEDSLPLEVHRYFARGPRAHAAALAKWALRGSLHRGTPPLARRLFTLHYASLCLPVAGSGRPGQLPSSRRPAPGG